jgi:hypothetical protein
MNKYRFSWRAALILGAATLTTIALVPHAAAQGRGGPVNNDISSDTDKSAYDKRDFSGLWARNPQAYKMAPCPECRDKALAPGYGFFGDIPPRTPEGERRMKLNKPGRGYELGSKEAAAHPDVDEGMKRAIVPSRGNDPEARCEPLGLMRLIAFSGGGATMQWVQTPKLSIQRFEWTWDNREIWTDGRKLPNVEDYLPRFNGYSVGHWEGNTLVVDTDGFDDHQWVDQFGYPVSEKAKLQERWVRTSPNRLRVDMTLTDPVTYTRPWKASPKIWAMIPPEKMEIGGWSGILEDRCVPSDEALFNTFRDHAGGLKK